jgi:hypothetical protein
MNTVTNEFMMEMLSKSKNYTAVILHKGPNDNIPERQQIIQEHGRKNFELRESGILSIVCPVTEDNTIRGIGIFNAEKQEVEKLLKEDPAIKAGVLIYEMLYVKSFPGDALP